MDSEIGLAIEVKIMDSAFEAPLDDITEIDSVVVEAGAAEFVG